MPGLKMNGLKIPQVHSLQGMPCAIFDARADFYQKYKAKLEQMIELNPRCNIYVCPVLPSRSHNINQNIFQLHRLLLDDLAGVNDLVKVEFEFSIVSDRGECQLPDYFYRIKKYCSLP